MPELPELEIISEVLNRRIIGKQILDVKVLPPGGAIVVRDLTLSSFEKSMTGKTFSGIHRRGKFLIFSFADSSDLFLAINPKLSGRLQLAGVSDKRLARTHVLWTLPDERQLRYQDQKQMGQVYLTNSLDVVPGYAGLGPEPFELTLDTFRQRLKSYSGEIKSLMTQGGLVAGIGNAYADEILWNAHIYPFRKRSQLSTAEMEQLYQSMQATLADAVVKVRQRMGEAIHTEPREFMSVHMKAGQPCPRCGGRISEVSANQRITNFCRTCQPGGLIKN